LLINSFLTEDGEVPVIDGVIEVFTLFTGTIRLWQTTPGKTYGLWQGTNGQ
jgi:hypothetical protein